MKPSGTIGPFVVKSDGKGNVEGSLDKFVWPTEQKAIENLVLDLFLSEREKAGVTVLTRQDGGTHDLDFRLKLSDGLIDLELMEVVIRSGKQIPFQSGHGTYTAREYADAVFAQIQKKIDKYGAGHEIPIDLLLYVTHEQYLPSLKALDVLRIYFRDKQHDFRRVYLIVPLTHKTCSLHELYINNVTLVLPPLEAIADVPWANMVSSEAKTDHGGISMAVPEEVLRHIYRRSEFPWKQDRNEACRCGSGKKFKNCHGQLT
jgi:SEC-C motif